MLRPFGSVAAVLSAALIVTGGLSASVVGCAMSSRADLAPEVDETLPGIDAAYDPKPGMPDQTRETDLDGGGGEPADTGTPTIVQEAGTDAAPPGPTTPKPTAGEVLITEVMFTTSGPEPASEWFEIKNLASSPRALGGLILKDGSSRTHVIVGSLTIAANASIVFARNKAAAIAAKVPAAAIAYEYAAGAADNAGILLANGATGGISLLSGATVIASAPYGGWFTGSGSSVQLKVLVPAQSTLKASWCLSATAWAAGSEKGTPGGPSDCP